MTARSASACYGMKELGALSQRYTLEGLMIAIALHLFVIGSYYGLLPLFKEEPTRSIICTFWLLPVRPPSISQSYQIPVGTPIVPPKANYGIPVPVPDIDVTDEPATEMFKEPAPYNGSGTGTTGVNPGLPGGTDDAPMIDAEPVDLTGGVFVRLEKWPIVVRETKPKYPEIGLRLGIEGTVVLKVLIDKTGHPKQCVILSSENDALNENAKAAAMDWLFTPAIMNGNTISVWARVPFRFRLNR